MKGPRRTARHINRSDMVFCVLVSVFLFVLASPGTLRTDYCCAVALLAVLSFVSLCLVCGLSVGSVCPVALSGPFSLFVFLVVYSVEGRGDAVLIPAIFVGLPFSLRLPLLPFLVLLWLNSTFK